MQPEPIFPPADIELAPANGGGIMVFPNRAAVSVMPGFPTHIGWWTCPNMKEARKWAEHLNKLSGGQCTITDNTRPERKPVRN